MVVAAAVAVWLLILGVRTPVVITGEVLVVIVLEEVNRTILVEPKMNVLEEVIVVVA